MLKATASAPSNIAFIKYWGKKNEELRLPLNGSVSMNLSNLQTVTTVEFSSEFKKDTLTINKKIATGDSLIKVINHLDRIRQIKKVNLKAKAVSENNFPESTGLSSSASGFAALTLASVSALGIKLTEKELTILTRLASGSACRSIPDGFVEWFEGFDHSSSYAQSFFAPTYWEISDIVAIISLKKKSVSTSLGQRSVFTSPFLETRLKRIKGRIDLVKKTIETRDFVKFGELVESEALEMMALMVTSKPSLFYLYPETVTLMRNIWELRKRSVPVYFTFNTGQNLHLLCQKKDVELLRGELGKNKEIKELIVNYPAHGAKVTNQHLF
jgi:diphosphomevalonate decarboxylase